KWMLALVGLCTRDYKNEANNEFNQTIARAVRFFMETLCPREQPDKKKTKDENEWALVNGVWQKVRTSAVFNVDMRFKALKQAVNVLNQMFNPMTVPFFADAD